MKRFVAVLAGLLIMPAYAEIAPIGYYDEIVDEYADEVAGDVEIEEIEEIPETTIQKPIVPVAPASSSARVTSNRTASRAMPAGNATIAPGRGTTTRAVASRTTTTIPTRSAMPQNVVSRAATSQTQQHATRRSTPARAATAARAATTAGSITQTDTVYSPLYTGRVSSRGGNAITAGTRGATTRIATSSNISATPTVDVASLDEMAKLTDYCKAQYTQCMDNFCDVLDDNQGRCSCSANLKNYTKTEEALKKITEELQEVAQKIQYIGLTKDELTSMFTQTEAEAAMQGKTDTTQLRSDLEKIKNMIVDVKNPSATTSDSAFSLDLSSLLDFSFSDSGFDLNSFFGTSANTSISNQRGEQLFKTAVARCKSAVLDSCYAQGVDTSVITNSYDLEIDKQCIVYERDLIEANTQMNRTVRNAKSVLQKARLIVAQNKNQYDLRGCVNALDTCMQDEFVCGSDYENCLDATGKYIVNGEIIVGSLPGVVGGNLSTQATGTGLYSSWNYGSTNAWNDGGDIGSFISTYISSADTTNMVGFMQSRIGYNLNSRNYGMCISVLNKCQDVTYTNGVYNKNNKVVENYLQRTLVQIKSQQDEILAKYAESCISDVSSCLSTNGWSTTADSFVQNTAQNACRAIIRTCASVINAGVNVNSSAEQEIIDAATNNSHMASSAVCTTISAVGTLSTDIVNGCPVSGYRCLNGYKTTADGRCVTACPANSNYDASKIATSTGSATVRGVVETDPAGGFCTCDKVGDASSGTCPL